MSVLEIADARKHLGITTTTQDAELQAIIDAAEAVIAGLVGPLSTETRTDRVRSSSGSLVLPVSPVVSMTSVTNADTTALLVDDLYLDTAASVITYGDGVSWVTPGVYDVVYVAGRETCPPDLLLAVKELVRHLWQSQRGPSARPGSGAMENPSTPGAAYLLPYRVQELLGPHLQPSVA